VEHVFRSKDKSEQHALSTLEFGLGRASFYIVSSNDFFWLVTILFATPMVLGFSWTVIEGLNRRAFAMTAGICAFAILYLFGFIFIYSIRRRRRAMLPQYKKHYMPETLTFKEGYVEYVSPYPILFPLREGEAFGQTTTKIWHFSSIERVSVFGTKSKHIASIDIKAGDSNISLNQFENRNELAFAFKTVVPRAVIEYDQPMIPLWAKILGVIVGIVLIGFYIWVVWLGKSSEL
jgi:hypothetical protein